MLILSLIPVLAGCSGPAPRLAPSDAPPQSVAALFREDPKMLLAAARKACDGPGEEFVRPAQGIAQCRVLLDPRTTAAVILNFDGDIEQLPQLVISLASARVKEGHLVTGCAFLKVPHKDGRVSRVVQNDRAIEAKLREMLSAVGGKTLRGAPPSFAERCFSL